MFLHVLSYFFFQYGNDQEYYVRYLEEQFAFFVRRQKFSYPRDSSEKFYSWNLLFAVNLKNVL